MNNENASLSLPKDIIDSVINQHIQIALSNAFGAKENIIQEVVNSVLMSKCDENGNYSKYSSDNKYTFIESLLRKTMRETIKKVLNEEMGKYEKQIKQHLIDDMKKKNSPLIKMLATSMAEGMVSAASDKWRFNVEITQPRDF